MMSLYCYFHPLMSEGFYAQVCEKAKTDEIGHILEKYLKVETSSKMGFHLPGLTMMDRIPC